MANLLQRLAGDRVEERQMVPIVPTWSNLPETSISSKQAYTASSTVHAVMNARMKVFSEVRFAFRRVNGELYRGRNLSLLDRPWPGGTGTELLARMIQDADLNGNAYIYRAAPDRLQRLDPNKVEVMDNGREKTGYTYYPDGIGHGREIPLRFDEVAHWAPLPHPERSWVGASWVNVVATELRTDLRMLAHQDKFYTNAATPNLFVKVDGRLNPDSASRLRQELDVRYAGVHNAYKTLVMDNGADLKVVGSDFQQMDYVNAQKSVEARIASAGGVPPIIVGLKAGLDASTYSNYGMAMRAFADHTVRPMWNSVVAALSILIDEPRGAELWFDDRDVAALRQDKTEEAAIQQTQANTIRSYIDAGYTPESAVKAVASGDVTVLEHTGLYSVQLQEAGQEPETQPAIDGGEEGESDE